MESNLTNRRIAEYLSQGKRFDGREKLEYRNIKIETGISKNAEGSARAKIGETEVLAGVKLGMAEPFTDSPESGVLMVTTELSPMASEKFEPGPPSKESIELARIVDRSIRESHVIDLDKMCIKKGEKVWALFIDIYPINDAGNLIDAATMAAMAALLTAVFPETDKEKEKIEYGTFTTKKLPLSEAVPIAMTFYKIGDSIILDPTVEEEEASEARLTIAMSKDKKEEVINAMQKGGSSPMSEKEIFHIIDSAEKEFGKIYKTFEEQIKSK